MSDLLAGWAADEPNARELPGAFMFADVSGFTALSERLQDRGREGAEILNGIITGVLTRFVDAARRRSGDILAFGGDAILVHFPDGSGIQQAAQAAAAMQASLAEPVHAEGVGAVELSVSIGMHAGTAAALRIRAGAQTEAIVLGPTISRTLRAEAAANAGEILVTHESAGGVPDTWHGASTPDGVLLHPPVDAGDGDSPEPPATVVPLTDLLDPAVARVAGTLDAEGQHRRVAVGFVRVTRLDEVVAEQGVDAAHAVVAETFGVLAEQCSRTGASILTVDSYPDAVKMLLCAGAPVATDHNEGALLEALQQSSLALRDRNVHMGANRGLAFAGDLGAPTRRGYTLLGDTVNLAARLMQRAAPGELLATGPVVERTELARTRLPPFKVKGKADDVVAFRVETGEGERAVVDLPLVGRDEEMARLDELAEAAVAGHLGAVEIAAPAGYGKSRLTREVRDRHPDLEPFIGRATAYGAASPYSTARRLLRVLLGIPRQLSSSEAGDWLERLVKGAAPDLLGDLSHLALPIDATVRSAPSTEEPAVLQRRAATSMARLVREVRRRPMLVVLDDVHWLDGASRAIVRQLVLDNEDRPWLFLAMRRPEGDTLFEGFPDALRLDLEPLDRTAAEELVRLAAGDRPMFDHDVDALVDQAQGNCLFLSEYAALGAEEVPDDVESLIASRLDRLDSEARRVATIAAVAGTSVPTDIVAAASRAVDGLEPRADAWQSLRSLLTPERAGLLQWRHPVFREVAYASLPFRRRRALHRAVHDAIDSSPSDGSLGRSVALALHADLGGMAEEAWELLRKTGERAAAEGASVDAVDLLTRAVRWADEIGAERVPPSSLAETLEVLGGAAELAGHLDDSLAALSRATELAAHDNERVSALSRLSRVQMQLGDPRSARSSLDVAFSLLGADDTTARAQLLVTRAAVDFRDGHLADCLERVNEILALPTELVEPAVRARACLLGDSAAGQLGDAEWRPGRGLATYELLGDDVGVCHTRINLGVRSYFEGDWETCLHHWGEASAAARRAGDLLHHATARNNIAEVVSDRGDWEKALEEFRAARRTWEAGHYQMGVAIATSNAGRASARRGDFETANNELEAALRLVTELGAEDMTADVHVRIAEAYHLAGRADDALAALDDARPGLDGQPGWLKVAFGRVLGCSRRQSGGQPGADGEATLRRALDAARRERLVFEQLQILHAIDPADAEVANLARRLGVTRLATPDGPQSLDVSV